ncbi:transposase, partial [Thermoleptolyngbya sp.]
MAIRLNRVANRLANRFLESDLAKSVADFLQDLDLSEIDLGEVFDNISLEDWTDDLRSGLESAIGIFSKDFNFTKLVENIDDLFGGVDLSDINFDALLKGVLGDISLNRLVKDLDQLLGSVEVEDLFKDSIDTLDWSDLAKRVRAIASEVFDDFSTGLAQLNLGDRTANLLRGSNVSKPEFLELGQRKAKGASKALRRKRKPDRNRKIKASRRWRMAQRRKSALQRKVTRQRVDWLHKLTSDIVRRHSLVAGETLNVKGMTRKAKQGSKQKAQKAGLN